MSAADAILARLDKVRQTGTNRWTAKCPAHDDRTPSLSIRELDDGRVLVHDYGGCPTADVMSAIGLTMADLSPSTRSGAPQAAPPHRTLPTYRPWTDTAAYLWSQSEPLPGTLAARYLEHRGCLLPPADGDLRYLPARGSHAPAMVARITDAVTAEPISLHLTRIRDDLTRGERHLLAGHRKQGGVIRLWPDEAVTYGLGLAEGIESALAAAHVFEPIWSCVDAGNLSAFPVLGGIESLMIVADHDAAGIQAAQKCARRWAASGCQVRIARPRTPGADAADVAAAPPRLRVITGGRP